MAAYLSSQAERFRGKTVLEVGSGVGELSFVGVGGPLTNALGRQGLSRHTECRSLSRFVVLAGFCMRLFSNRQETVFALGCSL